MTLRARARARSPCPRAVRFETGTRRRGGGAAAGACRCRRSPRQAGRRRRNEHAGEQRPASVSLRLPEVRGGRTGHRLELGSRRHTPGTSNGVLGRRPRARCAEGAAPARDDRVRSRHPDDLRSPRRRLPGHRRTVRRGGEHVRTEVVDTWAFAADDPAGEWMSMEHSRLHMGRVNPALGDTFVTTRRRPILTLVEDTSGGVHDTLLAACDRYRYERRRDRSARELHGQPARGAGDARPRGAGHAEPAQFVRERAAGAGRNDRDRAAGLHPGSHVTLRVELDAVLVLSACPQDMAPTNGDGPADAHYRVVGTTA